MNKEKHILIGKTIQSIELDEYNEAIKINTNEGEIIANCDADCCSYTWIEHLELPALGFPAKVTDALDLDMPDLGDMPDRDVVSYYGFKICTDKGDIVIDYRNDSNGYYGGELIWPGDYFHRGVWGQNGNEPKWREIKEDL